ncbi:hypothetical protein VTI74DRAFT_11626 [Chaetomium olivicolor]
MRRKHGLDETVSLGQHHRTHIQDPHSTHPSRVKGWHCAGRFSPDRTKTARQMHDHQTQVSVPAPRTSSLVPRWPHHPSHRRMYIHTYISPTRMTSRPRRWLSHLQHVGRFSGPGQYMVLASLTEKEKKNRASEMPLAIRTGGLCFAGLGCPENISSVGAATLRRRPVGAGLRWLDCTLSLFSEKHSRPR